MPKTEEIKRFDANVKGFVTKDDRELLHVVITTEEMDRDGDVLLVAGADVSHYEKNPLVFFQHSSYSLPIGKCVEIIVNPKQIEAWIEFRTGREDIDEIKECIEGGFLNAISIGFSIQEASLREPTTKERKKGAKNVRVISVWELLEISVVTIQSNRGALIKAFGFEEKDFSNPDTETIKEIKTLLESIIEGVNLETKAGRKISKANETLLDTIYKAIVKLRANLGKDGEEEGEEEEKTIAEQLTEMKSEILAELKSAKVEETKATDEETATELELEIKNYKFNGAK